MQVYIAFIGDENGQSRESWSVFYTPFVVGETEEEAERLAKHVIKNWYPNEDKEIYITGPQTVGVA